MATNKVKKQKKGDVNGVWNEHILNAIKTTEEQYAVNLSRASDLEKISNLDSKTFDILEPIGLERLPQVLMRQVTEKVLAKLQRPSITIHSETATYEERQAMQDGILYVMDEGGYTEALVGKPSAYKDAIMYGDGFVRIGTTNATDELPITFDNVMPTQIYVDSNATVMRSKTQLRGVTRMVVVYEYDISQAKRLYPNIEFKSGKVPKAETNYLQSFDKTYAQYNAGTDNMVEIAHYYDIGENPVYMIYAGSNAQILEQYTGEDYPFQMNSKPYIPIDNIFTFAANKGFFNKGLGHILYRYSIVYQQLYNKAIYNTLTALSSTKVLNVAQGRAGEMLKRLSDSHKMIQQGGEAIILNDSGEPATVSKLEAQQFDFGIQQAYDQILNTLEQWGIDMRGVARTSRTTATEILQNEELQQEFIQNFMNKNTRFFKFMAEATVEHIKQFVSKRNSMYVPTTVKLPKFGKVMLDEQGNPVIGKNGDVLQKIAKDEYGREQKTPLTGFTLGQLKELLDMHDIRIEVNTRSGIIQKDYIRTNRALLAMQMAAGNPAIADVAFKEIVRANNIEINTEEMPPIGQQQGGAVSSADISGAMKLTENL